MPLESLLGPEVTSLIAYATAILTAFGLLYGGAKILWTKATGRAFPSNRFTRTLDAIVELGSNVLGFVNKVKRADGSPLIPNPDVVARDALIADLRVALARMAVDASGATATPAADPRETMAPPAPIAPPPLRAVTLTGVAAADATQAQYELARREVASHGLFDATARQEIAADVVAEAQRLTAAPLPLVHTAASALHGATFTDPNDPKEPA